MSQLLLDLRAAQGKLLDRYRAHNLGDVSVRQMMLLRTLRINGPMAQRRIAELISSDTRTMASMVSLLEGRGQVVRAMVDGDKRKRAVAITPKGLQALEAAEAAMKAAETALLRRLGKHAKPFAEFLRWLADER